MQYGDTFHDRLELLMHNKDFLPLPKSETLRQLAEKKERTGHLAGSDIAKIANISTTSVNYWINKKSLPQMECLKLLSDAFGVSVEWLLAQTDSRNLKFKTGFDAFEELGFSSVAYENLVRLKEQGVDMKEALFGINKLLEFATQPHSGLSNEIEEYKKQADVEDSEEKQSLLEAADKLDKHVAEIQLPVLESLNKFFDLYPNGIYTYVPLRRVMTLGSLDEEDTETDIKKLTEMKNSLFTTMSPAQSDGAALFVLENNLKEIKKHLVEDEVNKLSQKDIKHFDDEYMPTFKGATYGYGASQERALEILCSFYSVDVDTSKMREKKHK